MRQNNVRAVISVTPCIENEKEGAVPTGIKGIDAEVGEQRQKERKRRGRGSILSALTTSFRAREALSPPPSPPPSFSTSRFLRRAASISTSALCFCLVFSATSSGSFRIFHSSPPSLKPVFSLLFPFSLDASRLFSSMLLSLSYPSTLSLLHFLIRWSLPSNFIRVGDYENG